jgi:glycine/D-amino acid oxidase-like deaminating enzyme
VEFGQSDHIRFGQTDRRIANFWGGAMVYTADFRPAVGVADEGGNVLYGPVYSGTGVPQTSMMRACLAEMVQGREHPSAGALQRRGGNWPPEPLR